MTDVANAVFDGTDAVMLSGETANGSFPVDAVSAMGMIVRNAELVNNYYATFSFVRDFTPKPFSTDEAVASCAVKSCIDLGAALILVLTADGAEARLVSKYRPNAPILVLTPSEAQVRATSSWFGQYAMRVERSFSLTLDARSGQSGGAIDLGVRYARDLGIFPQGTGPVPVVVLAHDEAGRGCVASPDGA
jgi:pyruvate kinase